MNLFRYLLTNTVSECYINKYSKYGKYYHEVINEEPGILLQLFIENKIPVIIWGGCI